MYNITSLRLAPSILKRFSHRKLSLWSKTTKLVSTILMRPPQDIVMYGEWVDSNGVKQPADIKQSFKEWKYFTDSDYGGMSNSKIESLTDEVTGAPFLRISGKLERLSIDDRIDKNGENIGSYSQRNKIVTNKCYTQVKGIFHDTADLSDQGGVKLVLRNKQTIYFKINLITSSTSIHEIFQLSCAFDPTPEWTTYHIPFIAFTHVAHGSPTGYDINSDMFEIDAIGFLFSDEAPDDVSWSMPFELDIKEISAPVSIDESIAKVHLPAMARNFEAEKAKRGYDV